MLTSRGLPTPVRSDINDQSVLSTHHGPQIHRTPNSLSWTANDIPAIYPITDIIEATEQIARLHEEMAARLLAPETDPTALK